MKIHHYWDTDGVEVYLDPKNTNSDSLVSGLYKILVNINNSALLNTTLGSGWVFWNSKINYRLSTHHWKLLYRISYPME
jgi:hypothetical protein